MSGRVKWHQRLHFEGGSVVTGNTAWDRAAGKSLVPGDCNWDTAARLIRALNGRDRTDVFFGTMGDECEDRQFVAAGGNAGRYLIMVQEPKCDYFLTRSLASVARADLVEVVVGGLPAFHLASHIHTLTTALYAAEHYFRTGRRSRKLSWMRGNVADRLRRDAECDWQRL